MTSIAIIDSHTGGEPTRVVLEDAIPLEGETMQDRLADFRERFDHIRTGLVCEPRGSEVLVGAALTPPVSSNATAGVIFFNTAGYLGMCGHGTIGVVETLRHLGRIQAGQTILDTPVGQVTASLLSDGRVELINVESYRTRADVEIQTSWLGRVIGDVAYGGNWFFIVREPYFDFTSESLAKLTAVSWGIRRELEHIGITGENGELIDHIELFDSSQNAEYDSKNFVLCPGGAYDRSPCGTGTSAKLACLYARGELEEGQAYRQASITGSIFEGRVRPSGRGVIPTIIGRAHITGEATLLFDDADPLRWGLST